MSARKGSILDTASSLSSSLMKSNPLKDLISSRSDSREKGLERSDSKKDSTRNHHPELKEKVLERSDSGGSGSWGSFLSQKPLKTKESSEDYDYQQMSLKGRPQNLATHQVSFRYETFDPAVLPSLWQNTLLQLLNLSGCQLTQIPEEIGNLVNLSVLILSNNNLTELPATLGKLTQLTELHLNYNDLTKKSFSDIELHNTKLTVLSASYNKLLSFPYGFTQCTSLEKLNLNNNQIVEISTAISNMTNLAYLGMNNNRLKTLCSELLLLPNLKGLCIAGNEIEDEPKEFANLRARLIVLQIEGNPFLTKPRIDSTPQLRRVSRMMVGSNIIFIDGTTEMPVFDTLEALESESAKGAPKKPLAPPPRPTRAAPKLQKIDSIPESPTVSEPPAVAKDPFPEVVSPVVEVASAPVDEPPPLPPRRITKVGTQTRCFDCQRMIFENAVHHMGYDWHKSCWEEYEELVPACSICNLPILDAKSLDDQWHESCYAKQHQESLEKPSEPHEVVDITVDEDIIKQLAAEEESLAKLSLDTSVATSTSSAGEDSPQKAASPRRPLPPLPPQEKPSDASHSSDSSADEPPKKPRGASIREHKPSLLSNQVEIPREGETAPEEEEEEGEGEGTEMNEKTEEINWSYAGADQPTEAPQAIEGERLPALPPRRHLSKKPDSTLEVSATTSATAPTTDIMKQFEDYHTAIDDIGYSSSAPDTPNTPSKEKPSMALLTRLASLSSLLSSEDDESEAEAEKSAPKKAPGKAEPPAAKKDVICVRCNMIIEAGDSYLAAMNAHWHTSCFRCQECLGSLEEGFYEWEGRALCTEHYLKKVGMVCHTCRGILAGGHYMEIGEVRFHEECFNCATCATNLQNLPFKFNPNGAPVCATACPTNPSH